MSRRVGELHALRNLAVVVRAVLTGTSEPSALEAALLECDAFSPRPYSVREAIGANGGKGECVDFEVSLTSEASDNGQILKSKAVTPIDTKSISTKSRRTWLSPFAVAWVERFGKGSIPRWGMLAKYLAPLVSEHGADETLRRWRNYLLGAEARYVSESRFAETFGAWDTPDPDAWRHDRTAFRPGESQDAYIARQTRGGR